MAETILFVIILLAPLVFFTAIRIYRLSLLLQYVNMEIGRTVGPERAYWEKEKRRAIRTFFFPFKWI